MRIVKLCGFECLLATQNMFSLYRLPWVGYFLLKQKLWPRADESKINRPDPRDEPLTWY